MGDVAKGKNPAAEYKETATADGAEPVCAGGLKHSCRLQVQKAIPTGAPLITDHRSVVTAAMCARDGGILLSISSGGRPEDLPSALVAAWERPRLTGTSRKRTHFAIPVFKQWRTNGAFIPFGRNLHWPGVNHNGGQQCAAALG
jgi:hypothetical protein